MIDDQKFKQFLEMLASSTYSYTQKAQLAVAEGLMTLISTMEQIQRTINTSPVWQSLAKIEQTTQKAIEAIERRQAFRKAIVERWDALENELKYDNRFFPKTDFLSIFDECTQQAGFPFKNGRILYRARKITENNLSDSIKNAIYNVVNSTDGSISQEMMGTATVWENLDSMTYGEWLERCANPFNLHDVQYWGYNAEKSDAPTSELAQKSGRVNPSGIAYLYAAIGFKTAIAEIQPMNGELISVAKIKTKKRLNLFSFEFHESLRNNKLYKAPIVDFKKMTGKSYWELEEFFDTISEQFSKPTMGNSNNYYATQYLSEYIKSKGFDGIKFKSSLKKGGSNIVLFDLSKDELGQPINYEILESSLHLVKNVTITSNVLLPKKL